MGFLDKLIGGGRALVSLPWQPSERPPERLSPVRLPRDERCHHHAIEWWYFMGYVDTVEPPDRSKRLSFIVSVIKGRVAGMSKLMGSVVLVDHAKKTHSVMTRLGLMGTSYFELHDGRAFQFHFGSAAPIRPGPPEALAIEGGMGTYSMVIDTSEQLVLEFDQKKGNPAVYLGEGGIMDYAGTDQMAYYLWPHLKVNGRWGTGRDEKAVTGQAWMEHQYGDIQLGDYHWRYLAVVIDERKHFNGEETGLKVSELKNWRLILFEFIKSGNGRGDQTQSGGKLHCVVISPAGFAYDLSHTHRIRIERDKVSEGYTLFSEIRLQSKTVENSADFCEIDSLKCSPLKRWSVPLASGDEGQNQWDGEVSIGLTPAYPDQEHRTALPPSLFPSYWEGACNVTVEHYKPGEAIAKSGAGWAAMQVFGKGKWHPKRGGGGENV